MNANEEIKTWSNTEILYLHCICLHNVLQHAYSGFLLQLANQNTFGTCWQQMVGRKKLVVNFACEVFYCFEIFYLNIMLMYISIESDCYYR